MTTAELRATALNLPEDERAALARDLIASLDGGSADPGADAAWLTEIDRRAREVAEGNVTLADAADVHAEVASRLRTRAGR
jgi:putative addiction module component (TIGR02574 family)